jgi:Tfp pilus assembly protein PilP
MRNLALLTLLLPLLFACKKNTNTELLRFTGQIFDSTQGGGVAGVGFRAFYNVNNYQGTGQDGPISIPLSNARTDADGNFDIAIDADPGLLTDHTISFAVDAPAGYSSWVPLQGAYQLYQLRAGKSGIRFPLFKTAQSNITFIRTGSDVFNDVRFESGSAEEPLRHTDLIERRYWPVASGSSETFTITSAADLYTRILVGKYVQSTGAYTYVQDSFVARRDQANTFSMNY